MISHPTQKLLSALLPLIEAFSKAQDTILDPFVGLGSTLMAAKTLGRSFIHIELDVKYHAIASNRLSA